MKTGFYQGRQPIEAAIFANRLLRARGCESKNRTGQATMTIKLAPIDTVFLVIETQQHPQHAGTLEIFEIF